MISRSGLGLFVAHRYNYLQGNGPAALVAAGIKRFNYWKLVTTYARSYTVCSDRTTQLAICGQTFDAQRVIPQDVWQAIERGLILSPSSFGLQPWRFIVVTSPEVKRQLPPISWNQTQPQDCSHMVVLAARRSLDAHYVDHFLQSVADTRGVALDSLSVIDM